MGRICFERIVLYSTRSTSIYRLSTIIGYLKDKNSIFTRNVGEEQMKKDKAYWGQGKR